MFERLLALLNKIIVSNFPCCIDNNCIKIALKYFAWKTLNEKVCFYFHKAQHSTLLEIQHCRSPASFLSNLKWCCLFALPPNLYFGDRKSVQFENSMTRTIYITSQIRYCHSCTLVSLSLSSFYFFCIALVAVLNVHELHGDSQEMTMMVGKFSNNRFSSLFWASLGISNIDFFHFLLSTQEHIDIG